MKSQKPDPEKLCIDMIGPISSPWNIAVIESIHGQLLQLLNDLDLPKRSEAYTTDLITSKLSRLKAAWRKFRPRFLSDGTIETADTLRQCIEETGETRAIEARHRSRRARKFERRVKTVKMTIVIDEDAQLNNGLAWKWLLKVLQQLGVDGMSSEDTDNSNIIETVYRVKVMEWRRNMDFALDLIDQKRLVDDEIYCPQGSKPAHRRRYTNCRSSARDTVPGLPRSFYDDKWYEGLSESYRTRTMCVSKDQFEWLEILCN
ncbi:hypothetical protein M422DRAFT_246212 [Sphaerobolus stellatus SS14]|nr:hypothetical protein M422DRAFT_246212 [Sphaerobolus stellatus SS14]